MFLIVLLACHSLVGDWEGEVDCGDYALDTTITLEWTGHRYEGEGTIDCTDAWDEACLQTFALQVDAERSFEGDQELDVDIDHCDATLGGERYEVGCDNPDDVEWDGADSIDGEWGGCDLDLFRD